MLGGFIKMYWVGLQDLCQQLHTAPSPWTQPLPHTRPSPSTCGAPSNLATAASNIGALKPSLYLHLYLYLYLYPISIYYTYIHILQSIRSPVMLCLEGRGTLVSGGQPRLGRSPKPFYEIPQNGTFLHQYDSS